MDSLRKIISLHLRKCLEENYLNNEYEESHDGIWLHGGTGTYTDGNFLYVTDELKEALHYARMKGGKIYKLKDEFNSIVNWALGQSEGMISQKNIEDNGGFNNIFELFIEL